MAYRLTYLLILMLSVTGCVGGSTNVSQTNEEETKTHATVMSADPDYINIDAKFDDFHITQYIGEGGRQQIFLGLEEPGESDSFQWALAIRSDTNIVGVVQVDDLEIILFQDYREKIDICCVNTLPFSAFDIATKSYFGVSGYVDFDSAKRGMFVVNFQEETALGSGQTIGQVVSVEGCWNIGFDDEESGCEL